MPELPEVESIRIQLEKFIVGHTIEKIEIRNAKYELSNKQEAISKKIVGVRRFGKVLVIDLSNNYSIVTHVKMTGQFIYRSKQKTENKKLSKKVVGGLGGKHTHVIFHLSSKGRSASGGDKVGTLYFNDYRRFGWMRLTKGKDLMDDSFIKKLGPEFLKNMTTNRFTEILSKSKKPIKVLLMDQEKMAGVGNIYANDALWLAQINPQKPANKLLNSQTIKLFKAIEKVLKEGIKRGGASELAFVTPDGGEGHYQDFTLVYGREGESCKVCKTPIKKIKLGGRGTYYCQMCQK